MPTAPVSVVVASPVAGLDAMLGALAEVTAEGVDDAGRVELIAKLEALKGAAAAAQARVTARLVGDREELGEDSRSVRAEVALARGCAPAAADRHVGVARALVSEMPETLAALERGEICERRAQVVVRETAALSREHRAEVDRQLASVVSLLGEKDLGATAREVAAELDVEALVVANERAVASRRVSVRPAAHGMAWLSVLGPLPEVVGAYASLIAAERRRQVIDPDLPDEEHAAAVEVARSDVRGKGAWLADTALHLLSGREPGSVHPVAVNVVMTDAAFVPGALGEMPAADVARIPGHGPLPGRQVRAQVMKLLEDRDEGDGGGVAVRRLFTDATGTNLVGMDSRQRFYGGNLRRFLELRDPICRMPFCGAPAVHVDHVDPVHAGGETSCVNGCGLCEFHNHVKEQAGWHTKVTHDGLSDGQPHTIRVTTPTGRVYDAVAPPITRRC